MSAKKKLTTFQSTTKKKQLLCSLGLSLNFAFIDFTREIFFLRTHFSLSSCSYIVKIMSRERAKLNLKGQSNLIMEFFLHKLHFLCKLILRKLKKESDKELNFSLKIIKL